MKWLHLSDLHIHEMADWNIYKKDLYKHCVQYGPIDLAIVTGDFHDFKDKEDFSKAKIFLTDLMKELKLDIQKDLFLIPGNHDGSYPDVKFKKAFISELQNNPTDINRDEWKELLSQFEAYEKFILDLITDYPTAHPASVHCRMWNNRINFIHCNTAVAADGETKNKNKQLIDINALAGLSIPDGMPSVILAHNHFFDIHEEHRNRIIGVMRNNKIRAYFCGDRHVQKVDQINIRDNQNHQIPCVVSYKSAPDAQDSYSRYGVIIGTWEKEVSSLAGWTWNARDGFKIDSEVTEKTIEMGESYARAVKKENADYVEGREPGDETAAKADDPKKEEYFAENLSSIKGQRKEFLRLYYNMSENQIEQFNRRFFMFRRLGKDESRKNLKSFASEAARQGYLTDMLRFINTLFRRDQG